MTAAESTSAASSGQVPRRGDYGLDAPGSLIGFAIGVVVALVIVVSSVVSGDVSEAIFPFIALVLLLVMAGLYIHTSRSGKFTMWDRTLDELEIAPDARVLDLGCGRGAVLIAAAKRLTRGGTAVGIDMWITKDQSGNAIEATRRNAATEGVARRVELHTGDVRELPFQDNSFDYVVSSLVIHNIKDEAGRRQALREAVRVLKPGGKLAIADLSFARGYLDELATQPVDRVQVVEVGPGMWWGGPWVRTWRATAVKRVAG